MGSRGGLVYESFALKGFSLQARVRLAQLTARDFDWETSEDILKREGYLENLNIKFAKIKKELPQHLIDVRSYLTRPRVGELGEIQGGVKDGYITLKFLEGNSDEANTLPGYYILLFPLDEIEFLEDI